MAASTTTGKFEEMSESWLVSIKEELIARTDIECSLLCIEKGCVSYAYNGNTKSRLISDEPTTSTNDIPDQYSVYEGNICNTV